MKSTDSNPSVEVGVGPERKTEPGGAEELPPCPRCGYEPPDAEFASRPLRARPGSNDGVDICLNCGQFMAFDEDLDAHEARVWGTKTPTPVPATSMDFAKYTPETCRHLLNAQSITARLARMRGYSLAKLKFRGGNS